MPILIKCVDKSKWPRGEWDQEPDRVFWVDKDTGLYCQAARHLYFGNWCGYVGVRSNHKLYQSGYGQVEEEKLTAHGGVNFFSKEDWRDICWFGFDCGHLKDAKPNCPFPPFGVPVFNGLYLPIYRTLEYVMDECRKLALQLKDLE